MSIIEFDKVCKTYVEDQPPVLEDVSLKINEGEALFFIGHSGSGKTTLLKMLIGELKPTSGSVYVNNVDITSLSYNERTQLRKNIGVVFQNFRLLHNRTVYENIAFVMEACGFSDEEIEEDVPYTLRLVNLYDKMWYFPNELSGGEQQRVAIARAIITRPEIVIADEPTGNLDPVNSYEIIEILKQVHKLGNTLIITTHDKTLVKEIGGRVVTLDGGRVKQESRDNYNL